MQYLFFYAWLISFSIIFSRVIHVVACIIIHFYGWIIRYIVYPTFCLSIHWLIRHLVCFHLLTIVNYATMIVYTYQFESLFLILLDIYLRMKLLSHMVILCLMLWGILKLFSTVAMPFYFPTRDIRGSQFLHIFTSIYYFTFFVCYIHPSRYDMKSHCGFD